MNIDLTSVLAGLLLGIAIAVPLTLVLDKRATRLRHRNDELEREIFKLESARNAQEQFAQKHDEQIEALQTALKSKFQDLANDALRQNSETFLELADQKHTQFTERTKNLVEPLARHLDKVEDSVRKLDKERVSAYASLVEQIKTMHESQISLRNETNRLVSALRQPKTRGRWGEIQLRNVLELVGMTQYVDFVTEHSVKDDSGARKRPDVVVRLPGEKHIIIDAKTPLDAYLQAVGADDEAEREEYLKAHARQLRMQVDSLAKTGYQDAVPESFDFVVMFIPGESFYSVALEYDANLFEYAVKKQVLITTPMSLILLLKVIVLSWQQEQISANSKKIAKIGRQLYERLGIFNQHINAHGKSLANAVNTFNKAIGSMQSRVLPSARDLESLEVASPEKKIDTPETIEKIPREI